MFPQGAEDFAGESHHIFLSMKFEMKELRSGVNHYSGNIEISWVEHGIATRG
jgi:hypothetical protein